MPRALKTARSPKGRGAAKGNHPQYKEMIKAALTYLKEKNGSSRQKILSYILANYDMGTSSDSQVNSRLKFALRAAVQHGMLSRNGEGVGTTGKFRLSRGGPMLRRKRRKSSGRRRRQRKRRSRSPRRKRRTRRSRRKAPKRKTKSRKRRRARRATKKGKARRRRTVRRRKARTPRRRRRRAVRRRTTRRRRR